MCRHFWTSISSSCSLRRARIGGGGDSGSSWIMTFLTLLGWCFPKASAIKPPELQPKNVAVGIESASMSPMIWVATLAGLRSFRASGGQVVWENPGMSKVVILKEEERRLERMVNEAWSPSPEGMRTTSAPWPCWATCQVMPSGVGIDDVWAISLN